GVQRHLRIYVYENDRSFAYYLSKCGPESEALYTPSVTRSAGDPDEISAGAGIGYFSLVWNIGQGLSKSILGGPSTLTETIAAALRDRISTNAQVQEVTQHKEHVTVRYLQDSIERVETARIAIMATPATVSHKIGVDLRPELREALGKVQYGSYVAG